MIDQNRMKKFTKGFTLIEMLIVVAVIAILAGIVLTGVTGFQAAARDTRRIADIRNTQNLLELYFNKCGHYPGTWTVAAGCGLGSPTNWNALETALAGELGSANLVRPPAGPDYMYGSVAGGSGNLNYVLGAVLERDNKILDNDLDGTYPGTTINCGTAGTADDTYCITP